MRLSEQAKRIFKQLEAVGQDSTLRCAVQSARCPEPPYHIFPGIPGKAIELDILDYQHLRQDLIDLEIMGLIQNTGVPDHPIYELTGKGI